MTPRVLTPDDVLTAALTVGAALRPVAGRDWSVQAGPLEWDVEQTITHMLGATAKYTLYLASRCEHFIGLTVRRWPDATNEEVIDSVVPVATGLAAVAAVTPSGVRAYHVTGPSSAADYVGRACVELLVHTDDALSGLGVAFAPPADLCQRVLAQQFPDATGPGDGWLALRAATGGQPGARDSNLYSGVTSGNMTVVTVVTDLDLPQVDYNQPDFGPKTYHQRLADAREHGWLAHSPIAFIGLDEESGDFFLRARQTAFPGRELAGLFGVTQGPLYDLIDANILNLTGDKHRRLRSLVGHAFTPRAADRWRPVMRELLAQRWAELSGATRTEFVAAIAKPYAFPVRSPPCSALPSKTPRSCTTGPT